MTPDYHSRLFPLLAYPSSDAHLLDLRAKELSALGIKALIEKGNEVINGVPILGKGYCGLVILAQWQTQQNLQKTVALKVRRTDAPKSSFEGEAENLAIANTLSIGPHLYASSENYIIMDYLSGPTIYHWLRSGPKKESVQAILHTLLWQCFQLDLQGIDHGNLRCITDHVFIEQQQPILIDFSSSSCDRRPANVTTLLQGVLWGTILSSVIKRYLQIPSKENLVPTLRQYKQSPNTESFQQVLQVLQLVDN